MYDNSLFDCTVGLSAKTVASMQPPRQSAQSSSLTHDNSCLYRFFILVISEIAHIGRFQYNNLKKSGSLFSFEK